MNRRRIGDVEILSGWKAIANHLGKGVRTVQRYEHDLGLPIRRPAAKSRGSVMATKAELDGWVNASPIRDSFPLPKGEGNTSVLLSEFRRHVADTHRLREEAAELRQQVKESLAVLHENIAILAERRHQTLLSGESRSPASVLTFDPKRKAN